MAPVDFSRLVLKPAMDTFARRFTVTPVKSDPFGAPYCARGIWTITQADLVLDDGSTMSSRTLKLGIRLCDFPQSPKQGDWITTPVRELPLSYWQGDLDPTADIDLEIVDNQPDGQGGSTLVCKRRTPV